MQICRKQPPFPGREMIYLHAGILDHDDDLNQQYQPLVSRNHLVMANFGYPWAKKQVIGIVPYVLYIYMCVCV